MALTIKGVDSNGRLTTGTAISVSAGVLIPPENAGVGDIVYCKQGADPHVPSNLKIIGWGTVSNANNINIAGTTYVPYGTIYGFVNGMARVVALTEAARRWTMLASDAGSESSSGENNVNGGYPVAGSTVSSGKNRMRNGKAATYTAMNLSRMVSYTGASQYTGPAASDLRHPGNAWDAAQVWPKAVFEGTTTYPDGSYAYLAEARRLYGTYENYLRQLLSVRNPGSCFAAHDADHKVHEQGKWNTYLLGQYTKSVPDSNSQGSGPCWYPAARYCFTYAVSGVGESENDHNWWLPSMDELFDLMIDEHWKKVNTCGVTTISNGANRWSSIRYAATHAWYYYGSGFSYSTYTRNALTARAVTLLKLV